ncbi:MAG: hypothetical protein HOE11_05195 [Candidatus Diapherotrites archaeon]|nr:hypothetical protein [Candidatus Diapherotrites archaeon]MBT4596577.1 hypothetical protein [Candidatus Diapherotrites archaeon]
MKQEKTLWGRQCSGMPINFEVNGPLLEKIRAQLLAITQKHNITEFKLVGRIKDEASLKGKQSRCRTKLDFLTVEYEDIGFRIIVNKEKDLKILANELTQKSDFIKDYLSHPRPDGLLVGDNPNILYRVFHIYTQQFENKQIGIQLLTTQMVNDNTKLKKIHGEFWKTPTYEKKQADLGLETPVEFFQVSI